MSVETQMSVPEHDSERKEKKNVVDTCISTFRVSLFPNVPPYVKFFMHDFKGK